MKTGSSLWKHCLQLQTRKFKVWKLKHLNINTLTSNMRLAEERANNAFRQHDAAWREEASNTVHMARSEIEASRYKAEVEERERERERERNMKLHLDFRKLRSKSVTSQHSFTRSSYGQTSAYRK